MGKFSQAIKLSRQFIAPVVQKRVEQPLDLVTRAPALGMQSEVPEDVSPVDQIDPVLVAHTNPDTYEAELFRIIRTKLFYSGQKAVPQSLLVTSAAPGEGKSFVAANLALTLARSIDQHVLLIDCDLRNPSIHRQFGLPDMAGLSDHLLRDVPLNQLLVKTEVNKLTILPAGGKVDNPSELLSSNRMKILIEEVKSRYQDRLVIVDAPPPKLVSETYAIGSQMDGILIVISYGKTPKEMLSELLASIEKHKVLGVIVNRYELKLFESRKYGRYQAYYRNRS